MDRPIIIKGEPFDWKRGAEAMDHAVDKDGNVNWRAASCADPGVTKCPKCATYFWREGELVECNKCGERWNP